eukprot:TRINITY_DN793_c0_g1_i1.p1 TRINITY_DN793_c0_g1~~TRINITY_DN793_c0_g1_i1.p1  ORF type:complete len:1018 (+),score=147.62 TRINITY_DN793_c0_g1_i1:100-3153(+)
MGCGSSVVVEPGGYDDQPPIREKTLKKRMAGPSRARKLTLTFLAPTATDAQAAYKHLLGHLSELQEYCKTQSITLSVKNSTLAKLKDPVWRINKSDYFICILGKDDSATEDARPDEAVKIAHLESPGEEVARDDLRRRQRVINTFYYHMNPDGTERYRCSYFGDHEELVRSFMSDMMKVIASDFPKAVRQTLNLVYAPVRLVHDSYLDARTVLLRNQRDVFKEELAQMRAYIHDQQKTQPFVVTGLSGMGKTSLLALFVHDILSKAGELKKPSLVRKASSNVLRAGGDNDNTPTRRPSRAMSRALRDASQRNAKMAQTKRLESSAKNGKNSPEGSPAPNRSHRDAEFEEGLDPTDPSSKKHPTTIITHAVGSSTQSTRPLAMLRRIMRALKHYAHIVEYTIPHKMEEVVSQFPLWLEEAASRLESYLIIVIDGIDFLDPQTEAGTETDNMEWLPHYLPPGVKIILSATKGSVHGKALLRKRCPSLEIQPLFGNARKSVILSIAAGMNYADISPEIVARLMSLPCGSSPLVLETLIREIQITGSPDVQFPPSPLLRLGSKSRSNSPSPVRRIASDHSMPIHGRRRKKNRASQLGQSMHKSVTALNDLEDESNIAAADSDDDSDDIADTALRNSPNVADSGRASPTINSSMDRGVSDTVSNNSPTSLLSDAKDMDPADVIHGTIAKVIRQLEIKYSGGAVDLDENDINSSIVAKTLCYLYASNVGLLEDELLNLPTMPAALGRDVLQDLHAHGIVSGFSSKPNAPGSPVVAHVNPNSARARVMASGRLTVQTGDNGEVKTQQSVALLINLASPYVRNVVHARCLARNATQAKEIHSTLGECFERRDQVHARTLDELPYHLAQCEALPRLRRYMGALNVYREFVTEARVFEFYIYWNVIAKAQRADEVMTLNLPQSNGMHAPVIGEGGEVLDLDPKDRLRLGRAAHLRGLQVRTPDSVVGRGIDSPCSIPSPLQSGNWNHHKRSPSPMLQHSLSGVSAATGTTDSDPDVVMVGDDGNYDF